MLYSPPCFWLQRRVNAQNRHAHFIGIYGVFVTSGVEYIGAVVVPGVRKFTLSASAETLGIYGVSFACSTETLGICDVFATALCPEPNDVHGLVRFENRASMPGT